MSRPVWFVEFLKKLFPYKNLIAKATKFPVVGRFVDNFLFKGDDIYFFPGRIIEINSQVETGDSLVIPTRVVEYFINRASDIWIMNKCQCRDALKCKNYPIDFGCLFMGSAARGINPKLGRPVSRDEALQYIKRVGELGFIHMVGRNKLDTFWLGVGPGDNLLTVCSCCPCCCLWTILPQITPKISGKLQRMPGVNVRVNENCTGCGECADGICFVNAIEIKDGRAVISDCCRGCGRCSAMCPFDAIDYEISSEDLIQKMVERISKVVDVE